MEPTEVEKAIAQFKALMEKPLPTEVIPSAPPVAPLPEEAPPAPPSLPGAPPAPCLDLGIRDLLVEFIKSLPVCKEAAV